MYFYNIWYVAATFKNIVDVVNVIEYVGYSSPSLIRPPLMHQLSGLILEVACGGGVH